MSITAIRAQVAWRTAALEERLTVLHGQLGELVDQLRDVQAQVQAGLTELGRLRPAQAAQDHAVEPTARRETTGESAASLLPSGMFQALTARGGCSAAEADS